VLNIPAAIGSFVVFVLVLKFSVEVAEQLSGSEQARNLLFGLITYTVSLLLSYLFGAFTRTQD